MFGSVFINLIANEFLGFSALSVFLIVLGGSMMNRHGNIGLFVAYTGAFFLD